MMTEIGYLQMHRELTELQGNELLVYSNHENGVKEHSQSRNLKIVYYDDKLLYVDLHDDVLFFSLLPGASKFYKFDKYYTVHHNNMITVIHF